MTYFYNTLGVLGAALLIILAFDLWRFLLKLGNTCLDCWSEESKKARKWMKDFKYIDWHVVKTSQPPNDKMITLHLRSRGNGEYIETCVSIDKSKY